MSRYRSATLFAPGVHDAHDKALVALAVYCGVIIGIVWVACFAWMLTGEVMVAHDEHEDHECDDEAAHARGAATVASKRAAAASPESFV